jgi:hypothetical protein
MHFMVNDVHLLINTDRGPNGEAIGSIRPFLGSSQLLVIYVLEQPKTLEFSQSRSSDTSLFTKSWEESFFVA